MMKKNLHKTYQLNEPGEETESRAANLNPHRLKLRVLLLQRKPEVYLQY